MAYETQSKKTSAKAMDAWEDAALIEEISGGNHRAFQVLMRRHLPMSLGVAQRMVGNPTDADEIAQEAFLKVWTGAARWRSDGQAQFKTWFYRVVINLCIDRKRKKTTEPLDEAEDAMDPSPNSFDQISTQETARLMSDAVNALPERQKSAITLFYYSDLSGSETAQALNVSVSALDSLLVRGRRALRARLMALGILDEIGGAP
ncbi:RNA polymerase sigma-70 factor, ECF subfamily [Azospirillaceae bacterium]